MSIAAGPWVFGTSEAALPSLQIRLTPDIQQRIAEPPTAREAPSIGRTPDLGIDASRNEQRIDVMPWVLRMKREADADEINAVLVTTGDCSIVEMSARDPWWGARPIADRYEGRNVFVRLWIVLRQ